LLLILDNFRANVLSSVTKSEPEVQAGGSARQLFQYKWVEAQAGLNTNEYFQYLLYGSEYLSHRLHNSKKTIQWLINI
jgi:hypothetical protein